MAGPKVLSTMVVKRSIKTEDLLEKAEPLFVKLGKLEAESAPEINERLQDLGMALFKEKFGKRSLWVSYNVTSDMDTSALEDAFPKIREMRTPGSFVYTLTLGELPKGNGPLEEYFIDAWGNCLLMAARWKVRETAIDIFRKLTGARVVPSFDIGPGRKEMGLESMKDYLELTDAESIGVTLTEGYNMVPQKTIVGMYLFFDGDLLAEEGLSSRDVMEGACSSCYSRDAGCKACTLMEDYDAMIYRKQSREF